MFFRLHVGFLFWAALAAGGGPQLTRNFPQLARNFPQLSRNLEIRMCSVFARALLGFLECFLVCSTTTLCRGGSLALIGLQLAGQLHMLYALLTVPRSLLWQEVMVSLETLTDGVAMVARSWTNMSEIPEHELDEQIKALCMQSSMLLH